MKPEKNLSYKMNHRIKFELETHQETYVDILMNLGNEFDKKKR